MIIAERLLECSEYLAMSLNPVDGDEQIDLDGNKINLQQFLPIVFKHMNKIILKYPDRSEEIFLYLVDAIHYSLGMSDSPPDVTYMTPDEMQLRTSGHDEPVIKIKTK